MQQTSSVKTSLRCDTRFFLFLIFFLCVFAAPYAASGATPIGYFDGLGSNGAIWGWAIDLDAPSNPLDIHVYMDGPEGGGGRLIGVTKAAAPRPDVNQATGYPGDHGFVYFLPPVTRDGTAHTYYVYGIDTSGVGSQNQLLVGAPRTATLPSTILRMDNGIIRVGVEPRCGGTIAEIVLDGKNLVNEYDCTGRQIQVSQYDGNFSYDPCAGCTGSWGWNPVQGGDRYGFGSTVLAQTATRDNIYIKTQPYHWMPEEADGGPGRPIISDVIVEQWLSFVPGSSDAIKMHLKITHQGSDYHTLANQEFPAVYVNLGFDRLVYYSGVSPWTGAAVNVDTARAGVFYNAAENWAAFVDNRENGLTVYVPGQYPYLTGFRIDDSVMGPYSNGFNYFTPFVPFEFGPGRVLEGDVYLIVGDYRSARQMIYSLESSNPAVDILPPFGFLDMPSAGRTLEGKVPISGWVFDDNAVSRIEIQVDGKTAGMASYGQPRPDVSSVFPNIFPNTGYVFMLDTTRYSNGSHVISVNAVDAAGNTAGLLKSVTVTTSNVNVPVTPTSKFVAGNRVRVRPNRLNIYKAPSGRKIGTQFKNVLGTIMEGPVSKGGYTWWNVNFDSGIDGWAIETYLDMVTTN
jgi:hypothetical protein